MVDCNTKVLVFAPHADDEAFGLGGTLSTFGLKRAWTHLVVCSIDDKDTDEYHTRMYELQQTNDTLNISHTDILYPGFDGALDTLPMVEIVSEFDSIIGATQWDYVFFPYPSHHQDHRVVQQAVIATFRPGSHKTPKNMLMYEYTYPTWSNDDTPKGRYYVEISELHMTMKMRAIHNYNSQLREFPHPVSAKAAETLARIRGMAIGVEYAEMFYVVQMIGDI